MNRLSSPTLDGICPIEQVECGTSRAFSRSPQPYHRRSGSLSDDRPAAELLQHEPFSRSGSTESGTEADDERGRLLKLLPSPPIRARKGLRGTSPKNLTPAISPLPTPPAYLGQDVTAFFGPIVSPKQLEPQKEHEVEKHKAEKHEAYRRRKKGELLRRSTELLLTLAICAVTWTAAGGISQLEMWSTELLIYAAVPCLLYALHPLLRSCNAYRSGTSALRSFFTGFHVPSRFDPGPLIYPVLLPVMVSLVLFRQNSAYLTINTVCGLASIPQTVFAAWPWSDLIWYVRWLATILPFSGFRLRDLLSTRWLPLAFKVESRMIAKNDLILIFPLHESLKQTLAYLTTTSLDPSELELLSTALINLWIFASSPQAQILKAALWIGGLSVFVTCRHLLAWEVELARIPKWKFSRQHTKDTFTQRFRRACAAFMKNNHERDDSSDDEIDARVKPLMRAQTHASPRSSGMKPSSGTQRVNGSAEILVRRNTMSKFDQKSKQAAESKTKRTRQKRGIQSSAFLSLSLDQATMRKYIYATAVYLLLLTTIMLPVFSYVSRYALHGYEPIGWAIGYAVGDVPPFRRAVVAVDFEKWIPLPVTNQSTSIPFEGLFTVMSSASNIRLVLCAYCLVVLIAGITVVVFLTAYVEVDTRRKVFHGVMVAMLLPTIFVDPCFISLALIIILSAFLLLDLCRASQLPPISKPLTTFLAPYTDGRDHRGPVIVSPIFLLIGCAIPLWLSLAGVRRSELEPWEGWNVEHRDLGMISGVVCVGMGDAAASLIGRRYGRTKWYWGGGKSVEGSLAFAIAVTLGLTFAYLWLRVGGWTDWEFDIPAALTKSVVAGLGASLLESVLTAANDNVVVPIGLWLLVKGLDL